MNKDKRATFLLLNELPERERNWATNGNAGGRWPLLLEVKADEKKS